MISHRFTALLNMRLTRSIFVSVAFLAVSSLQADAKPEQFTQSLKGSRYRSARQKLILAGFAPVKIKRSAGNDACLSSIRCNKYPETIHCWGTGIAPCLFAFFDQKNMRYFLVRTYGEEKLTVDLVRPSSRREIDLWYPHAP